MNKTVRKNVKNEAQNILKQLKPNFTDTDTLTVLLVAMYIKLESIGFDMDTIFMDHKKSIEE